MSKVDLLGRRIDKVRQLFAINMNDRMLGMVALRV
jgi:hypothetical protein